MQKIFFWKKRTKHLEKNNKIGKKFEKLLIINLPRGVEFQAFFRVKS